MPRDHRERFARSCLPSTDECRRKIIEAREKMRVSGLALSATELRTSAIDVVIGFRPSIRPGDRNNFAGNCSPRPRSSSFFR